MGSNAAHTDHCSPQHVSRGDRLARGLAAAVLVASILPVVLLGPSLLRAPLKLERELHADVQRLAEHGLSRPHARAPRATSRTSGGRR
jgi:hypothetical protein